jgi:hypothetical protein
VSGIVLAWNSSTCGSDHIDLEKCGVKWGNVSILKWDKSKGKPQAGMDSNYTMEGKVGLCLAQEKSLHGTHIPVAMLLDHLPSGLALDLWG